MVIEPAWIVGVGMTRFGVRQDVSVNNLPRDAVSIALRDAGAELGDIDAATRATVAMALHQAALQVRAGAADVVIAVGVDEQALTASRVCSCRSIPVSMLTTSPWRP